MTPLAFLIGISILAASPKPEAAPSDKTSTGAPDEKSDPVAPGFLAPTSTGGRWYGPISVPGAVDAHGVPVADGAEGDRKVIHGDLWLYVPKGCELETLEGRPLVLALHGWDHSPKLFIEKSTLAEQADRFGFVVAIPDTGRTIFETSLYGERLKKWGKFAGAPWIRDVILPYLRTHHHVGLEPRKTAVIGYSTGGRGACLLAALYGGFGYVGSVSGTYDLMTLDEKIGEYRIHEVVYGKRSDPKKVGRWQKDNVTTDANLEKLAALPLFLAHGKKDKAVPYAQMVDFAEALSKARAKVRDAGLGLGGDPVVKTIDGAHDWAVWNATWGPMFEGFDEAMKR
jgi:S-formylglutathione hydrolase FrmB